MNSAMKCLLARRASQLIVVCLYLANLTASGAPFAKLQSSCLGDGWFQYTLTNLQDPFFREADIVGFDVRPFTNFFTYGADPVDWQRVSPDTNEVYWNFTGSVPQNRPYQVTFLAQSQYTSYHTANGGVNNGATILFLLWPQDYLLSPNYSNIAGFYAMACLEPCPPDQADGSPSNLVSVVELVPDVMT